MSDFDDEIDSILEETDEGSTVEEPRMAPTRRTVLDEIRVTGDPEGRRGQSVGGRRGRVVTGDLVDANAPMDNVPMPRVTTLPETRIKGETPEFQERQARRIARAEYDREAAQHSPLWDALLSITNAPDAMVGDSRRRTGERISRAWDRLLADPAGTLGAAEIGVAEGVTGGLADEAFGIGMSLQPRFLQEAYGYTEDPGHNIQRTREVVDDVRGRAPEVYGAAETGGTVAGALAVPGAGATTAAGRVGAGIATGAVYGGLSNVGHSDPESLQEAQDAFVEGAIPGGITGGVLAGAGEGLRRLARPETRAAARLRADEATLAATGRVGTPEQRIGEFLSDATDRSDDLYRREVAQAADTLRTRGVMRAGRSPHGLDRAATTVRRGGDLDDAADGALEAVQTNARRTGEPASTLFGRTPILGWAEGQVRSRAPTVYASGVDRVARMIERNPERFGRYGQVLSEAAGRGTAALGATVHVLTQRDPEFRRQIEELEQQTDEEQPETPEMDDFDREIDSILGGE